MKHLNYERLSKSGFTNRLLDFVKEYEKARNITLYDDVVDWIVEEKTDCIKAFLSSPQKKSFKVINILLYKINTLINRVNLINRKRELYQEFLSFYE